MELLKQLASATAAKIASQMEAYTTGKYKNPTQKMLDDAASAPVHNMWAERCLGILDALQSRAPNACLGFLEPKVRAQMNYTLEWVESQTFEDQKELLKFCIGRGRHARQIREDRKKKIQQVIFDREKVKCHKRDVTARNKIYNDIRQALIDDSSVLCLNLSLFNDIPESQVTKVGRLWEPHNDTYIETLFWQKDSMQNIVKKGRVIGLKPKKKEPHELSIRIAYWLPGEDPASSVDSNILFANVLADIIVGTTIIL